MTTLTLRAVSLDDRPLTQPITALFDAGGGSIGRADHNTLALPDPERHISRVQAEIRCEHAVFSIRNVGSANPIVVAGRPLACGESTVLAHGAQIVVGGYRLEAMAAGGSEAEPVTVMARRPAAAATGAAPERPMPPQMAPPMSPPMPPPMRPQPLRTDTLPPVRRSDDPFADLLGPPATPPPLAVPRPAAQIDPFGPPAGVPAQSQAMALPPPAPRRLPDDFDPFARPAPAPVPVNGRPAGAPPAAAGAFDDLLGASPSPSLDVAFGLGGAGGPGGGDLLADFLAAPLPARAGAPAEVATDPLAMFGSLGGSVGAAALPQSAAVQPDATPELHAGFVPPAVVPPSKPLADDGLIPTDATWLRPAARSLPPPAAPVSLSVPVPLLPAEVVPAPVPVPVPVARSAAPVLEVHAPRAPSPLAVSADGWPVGASDQGGSAPTAPPLRPMPETAPAPSRAVAAVQPPAAPRVATATSTATQDPLWAAFCDGAGLAGHAPLDPAQQADQLRRAGRVLRAAIDGSLQLMAVRATAKHELRAQVTVIQSRENNPLKFSPDAQGAIEQLLQPPLRGFLDGPAAMQDAMRDLLGHAIGTMAGMRAALDGVLARFAPLALEGKLADSSLLDRLPLHRKARLWDLYRQHAEAIRDEAQEDFHTLFGKAFLAAYEQQVSRLDEAPHTAAPGGHV